MLTELHKDFLGRFGGEAATAKEGALSKRAKNLMTSTCKKYEDSSTIDKAQAVLSKVDGVKAQMQDNIAGMLKNTEKAESLAEQSDQLNEQASVFKKSSADLKKQMKCKNLKMTLLLGGLVVGILVVILVPLIMRHKNNN
jgi:CHASE3 domain sensor protein